MNQSQPQQKQIQISDNISGAEYANMMQVGYNRDEFHLLFFNIFPPSGKVSNKIITTPGHFKRIIKAMQESLKKYESQHGEIKEADEPTASRQEIGFRDKK